MHNAVLTMVALSVMYNIAYEVSEKKSLRFGRTLWLVGAVIALLIQIVLSR